MTAEAPAGTLLDLLDRAGDTGERGLHLLDRRERELFLPWSEVVARAERTAAALAAAGVRPGDRVALVFPTGAEFFDAFFGALRAGAVPTPLYPPVRLGRLAEYHGRTARMVSAAGARLVLADARVRRLLGQAIAAARPPLGCRTLGELPSGGAAPESAVGPDDLGLVQFSSGTTVDPKPVALTHRALLAQTATLNDLWPALHGDELPSGVSWLPLYHDMGLIGCVFPALAFRADLTLLGPELFVARPATWLRAISRSRATISPAPNFAYGLCVSKIRDEELAGVDLSSWRVALNGAEPVSARTMRAFADRFARWGFRPEALSPVYGLSEAALAVTFPDLGRRFRSERFERRSLEPGGTPRESTEERGAEGAANGHGGPDDGRELVSVGRPLPGFEIEIRGDDRRPLGPAGVTRVGHVWVRGPSLMAGYLGRPRATARALRDGWLDTGDLGFLSGGELFLTGRAKDLVILRGRNYGPEEIEAAAWAAPGARTGCAVAASWMPEHSDRNQRPERADWGDREELVVFVEVARNATEEERRALPEAVRRAVAAAVGPPPDRVEVLAPGTLPRTSSGKLRRAETLRRWREGALDPPDATSPWRLAAAVAGSTLAFARLRLEGGREPSAGSEEP